MLHVTADGSELYLEADVSGDYAELLWQIVLKQFLVEGRRYLIYFVRRFASRGERRRLNPSAAGPSNNG